MSSSLLGLASLSGSQIEVFSAVGIVFLLKE